MATFGTDKAHPTYLKEKATGNRALDAYGYSRWPHLFEILARKYKIPQSLLSVNLFLWGQTVGNGDDCGDCARSQIPVRPYDREKWLAAFVAAGFYSCEKTKPGGKKQRGSFYIYNNPTADQWDEFFWRAAVLFRCLASWDCMPPQVFAQLFSDIRRPAPENRVYFRFLELFGGTSVMPPVTGYWDRAGKCWVEIEKSGAEKQSLARHEKGQQRKYATYPQKEVVGTPRTYGVSTPRINDVCERRYATDQGVGTLRTELNKGEEVVQEVEKEVKTLEEVKTLADDKTFATLEQSNPNPANHGGGPTVGEQFADWTWERMDDLTDGELKADTRAFQSYENRAELEAIILAVMAERATQPFLGRITCAVIMDSAMARLKKDHGIKAPGCWLPTIKALRGGLAEATKGVGSLSDAEMFALFADPAWELCSDGFRRIEAERQDCGFTVKGPDGVWRHGVQKVNEPSVSFRK